MSGIVTEGMRIESILIDELRRIEAIDPQMELLTWARMNFEAIASLESSGFFIREPVHGGRTPPIHARGPIARGIVIEANLAVIDGLITNGILDAADRLYWHKLAQSCSLIEFAPRLFRELTRSGNLTTEQALEILDRSFVAVTAPTRPPVASEREWQEYCKENPRDPICWIGRSQFLTPPARHVAQGILVASALHRDGLLKDEQIRAIYEATYRVLTMRRGVSDLDLRSAGVIIDGLKKPNDKQKCGITNALAAAQIGLVDPEGPWAELCQRPNPPRICNYITLFPVAAKFTSELIRQTIWPQDEALAMWETIGFHLEMAVRLEYPATAGPLEVMEPAEAFATVH